MYSATRVPVRETADIPWRWRARANGTHRGLVPYSAGLQGSDDMRALSTRSQFAATVSPMAIGLAMLLGAGAAQAQDIGTPPPADPPQQTEEEKTEVTPSGT